MSAESIRMHGQSHEHGMSLPELYRQREADKAAVTDALKRYQEARNRIARELALNSLTSCQNALRKTEESIQAAEQASRS